MTRSQAAPSSAFTSNLRHRGAPIHVPIDVAHRFAEVKCRLAGADIGSALQILARSAADTVPGAELAGVTLIRKGKLHTAAATGDVVRHVDAIQYVTGSGPCVDAVAHGTVLNASDLRIDQRWRRVGQEAYESAGIVSVLSIPLMSDDGGAAGALNTYSRQFAAFDDSSESIGLLLASYGELALAGADARRRADNLFVALTNSRDIGVAMGVLMDRHKITREQAFDLLRLASRQRHQKLSAIALAVGDTGELPVPETKKRTR